MATPPPMPARDQLAGAAYDGPDEMGREIAEGPDAVATTLRGLASMADQLRTMFDEAERIVVLATGASLAATLAAEPMWRAYVRDRTPLVVRQSAEAVLDALDGHAVRAGDLVLAVSQSGTSPETLAAAQAAGNAGARVMAITAHPESVLAKTVDAVITLGSGEERGASTKSELATLAVLLTLAGLLPTDDDAIGQLHDRLMETARDWERLKAGGRTLADAHHVWILGFGTAFGVAQAGSLLWHEKVGRPAVAATPSEFRHGQIEAATERDAVILVDVDASSIRRASYLDLLRRELEVMNVALVEVPIPRGSAASASPAELALHALLDIQQLARATALAAGTYFEEFAILRRIVTPAAGLAE